MKRFTFTFLMTILLSTSVYSKEYMGKIIYLVGYVDITSLSTGKKFVPDVGIRIQRDYKIRTGKKSFVEILLNNGTKLFIKEVSVINISSLKLKKSQPPTRIRLLTGKIRIVIKKTYRRRTMILKTPTAIAGVRGTDFGVIAGKYETKIVVFKGAVEVANSSRDIIKSYIIKEREEISVKYGKSSSTPRVVPVEVLSSWFQYYDIDEQNRIILRRGRDNGIIDKILRKKKF